MGIHLKYDRMISLIFRVTWAGVLALLVLSPLMTLNEPVDSLQDSIFLLTKICSCSFLCRADCLSHSS